MPKTKAATPNGRRVVRANEKNARSCLQYPRIQSRLSAVGVSVGLSGSMTG